MITEDRDQLVFINGVIRKKIKELPYSGRWAPVPLADSIDCCATIVGFKEKLLRVSATIATPAFATAFNAS